MKLSPRELEKTHLCNLGIAAQRKLAMGNRLSAPDATALLSCQVLYFARKGVLVSKLMHLGTTLLGRNQVIPGVETMVETVQVEAQFPDGTKLVTLHDPISKENGDLRLALEGSFLPVPDVAVFTAHAEEGLVPGELIPLVGSNVVINKGRDVVNLTVTNTADRPIQVGSHYHFIETNPYLDFDRSLAYGMRLNICAGASVRFEPGASLVVSLVSIAGNKIVRGGNALCNGSVSSDPTVRSSVIAKLQADGFRHSPEPGGKVESNYPGLVVDRKVYAHAFGPTTGDVLRLGDTELYIRVEKDYTVYGDECVFGGGKVIREGMGQATGLTPDQQLDTVVTNALILDHSGIYKADIGIKKGRIVGIGKAGNPDVMEGVMEGMVVGVNTEVIAAEGLIVTAGGIDTHVHFICPQLVEEALCSGLTTLVGGGTGPATGTCATTCTPGPYHIRMMMQSTDAMPMNFGFTGKGNSSDPAGLNEVILAGAVGLKLHEDWGTTPAAIDNCLAVADKEDVQVTIHTDTLNESSCVEKTIATFKGRTIHSYHTEGAGGGHAPDIITVVGQANVIPSSTNPTRPFTVNTLDEHLDMLMVCHHLDKNIPNDVAFAESRIRAETMAAEDILHDMGAISIISSDSQAMGRIGEVLTRTWQTADKMKRQRGQLSQDEQADAAFYASEAGARVPIDKRTKTDNFRVRRYVAKCTINPAIAHGLSHEVGSVEVGKLADLVLWKPSYFGAKPEIIVKGGHIAYAQMGDPNASIPTTEPVMMRPMFGAYGRAASESSVLFVSSACLSSGVGAGYNLNKTLSAVTKTRGIGKRDMVLNDYMPNIKVDPETYKVTVDDVVLACEPAQTLPLTTRYFMI